jgi:nucleoside-diphosphate-sugar epimerase
MTIVLTGGSGFIGTQLAQKLLALGDTVVVVDLKAPSFTHEHLFFIQCDISSSQLPFNVLEHTDAVINLAGAPSIPRSTTG